MGNIHKQFGGSGLVGSMLSLDGIDCSAVYPNDLDSSNHGNHERDNSTINRERERERERDNSGLNLNSNQSLGLRQIDRERIGGNERDERIENGTHKPLSIGFSVDGRLSGVTTAAALRVSEIERGASDRGGDRGSVGLGVGLGVMTVSETRVCPLTGIETNTHTQTSTLTHTTQITNHNSNTHPSIHINTKQIKNENLSSSEISSSLPLNTLGSEARDSGSPRGIITKIISPNMGGVPGETGPQIPGVTGLIGSKDNVLGIKNEKFLSNSNPNINVGVSTGVSTNTNVNVNSNVNVNVNVGHQYNKQMSISSHSSAHIPSSSGSGYGNIPNNDSQYHSNIIPIPLSQV